METFILMTCMCVIMFGITGAIIMPWLLVTCWGRYRQQTAQPQLVQCFSYSGGKAVTGSKFGLVNGTSLPIHFHCNGDEKSLYDCAWLSQVARCQAEQGEHGAGVECYV